MGRKAKIHEPFEERIENHPWKRFPEIDNNCTHLIIGSFPPNKFTTHNEKQTFCDMDFFYGSKENAFWELFVEAKNQKIKLPNDLDNLKKYLRDNNWVITDIIKSTQRKKDTAYDTDLINIEWNSDLINDIFTYNKIQKIYFTSKWVKDKFDLHIREKIIDIEKLEEFILLSPSRNGLRKAKLANFTEHKPNENETAENYRKRYYSLVLNK
jgi:G:T/U-mismatch repair DNA glycosylase